MILAVCFMCAKEGLYKSRGNRVYQEWWGNNPQGRWMMRLIRQLDTWIHHQHDDTDYFLTQFLTWHGYFHAQLYKLGKLTTPRMEMTHIAHFLCVTERHIGNTGFRKLLDKSLLITLLTNRDHWTVVAVYFEEVLC